MPDGSSAKILWREHDASRINAVLNHPEIRPWVADMSEGEIDISQQVANPRNVLLMGKYGGCMCFQIFPGVYEVHTQVLPEGRGKWSLDFVRAGSDWMFTRTDCYDILTRVPMGHVAARALALAAGMMPEFQRPDGCKFLGETRPVEIMSFRVQDWMRQAPGLVELGMWFHAELQREAARLDVQEPAHTDDENHNRYAGAALAMIIAGQLKKGVALYNRWAVVSRHKVISIVEENPPVIRFDLGLLRFVEGRIQVSRP